jgi:hypothetical protein
MAMAQSKPDVLVIWGHDNGMWNFSSYHRGAMDGRMPAIAPHRRCLFDCEPTQLSGPS